MSAVDLLILLLVALLSFGLAYVGASVGLVLGQLRLPALVYWLASPVAGAATSLAISTVGALVGAIRHARSGRVSMRLILTIGAPSAVAAFVSARFAAELDPLLVKSAIGVALLVTSAFMLRKSSVSSPDKSDDKGSADQTHAKTSKPEPAPAPAPAVDADADPPRGRWPIEVVVGAVLGAVAGLVGLLMGTLRLPIMLQLGTGPARAIGTNLAIGCITGIFAGVATVMEGSIDWLAFAVVTPMTMLGAYLGASATGRMRQQTLRTLIAVSLVVIGLWMLWDGVGG